MQLARLSPHDNDLNWQKHHLRFCNIFSGYNRIFGFSGNLMIINHTLLLDKLIISCSGSLNISLLREFEILLSGDLKSAGWTIKDNDSSCEIYTRIDYELLIIKSTPCNDKILIHLFVRYGATDDEMYYKLFKEITSSIHFIDVPINSQNEFPSEKKISFNETSIEEVIPIIKSNTCVAYTGAGISQASGIPTFSGSDSLNDKFRLSESFPGEVYELMIKRPSLITRYIGDFQKSFITSNPSLSHIILADFIRKDIIKYIITRNYDSLHQLATTKKVLFKYEFLKLIKLDIFTNFTSKGGVLLVIGISRDEDDIIAYFRKLDYKLIVINPEIPNYLTEADFYFKEKAEAILPLLSAVLCSNNKVI